MSRCTQIKEVLEISVTALSALRGISVIPRSSVGARDLEISAFILFRLKRILGIGTDTDTRYRYLTVAVSGCRYRLTVSETDTVIQLPIPTF